MSLTHKPPRNIVDVNLTRVIASRCAAMLMKSGDKKGNFQMQKILVIDRNQQPLMPCHPARARQLLALGKASVFKRFPFTIVLHARQVVAVKIDPGSKETGLVLVGDFERGKRVIWAAVIAHRGQQIKNALERRRELRRGRRARHTRYRPARFNNRTRPAGWLPPSLGSRVENIWTWVARLSQLCSIDTISQELVKFDTQLMENAEISGVEYQQGELAGYEVRQYLLEKWERECAYCGEAGIPLEIEHILPKSRGGGNRVSNLTLACRTCNEKKGAQTAGEFGYPDIQRQAKLPLKDAAAVNATRWALYNRFVNSGLPVEAGTGGQTKFNRSKQGYPKTHWIDAACVGQSGQAVSLEPDSPYLYIKATGHGSRQMCRTDKFGFPSRYRVRQKRHFGFQTGDMVYAIIPAGKYAGRHTGRVACRAAGGFDISSATGKVSVNQKYCSVLHRADGYSYRKGGGISSPCVNAGLSMPRI